MANRVAARARAVAANGSVVAEMLEKPRRSGRRHLWHRVAHPNGSYAGRFAEFAYFGNVFEVARPMQRNCDTLLS